MAEAGLRRVMIPVRLTVIRGFIANEHRLVAAAEPKAVTAVVGGVANENVSRTPRLHAVVVGVRSVVFHEHVSPRHPPIERSDENAVTAVSNVVAIPVIIVGSRLDEHAGRIARVDLFGRAVDADAVGQVVFEEFVPGRPPQLGAGIRAVGKIVVGNQIVIRVD